MKKVLLLSMLIFTLLSCKKENITKNVLTVSVDASSYDYKIVIMVKNKPDIIIDGSATDGKIVFDNAISDDWISANITVRATKYAIQYCIIETAINDSQKQSSVNKSINIGESLTFNRKF